MTPAPPGEASNGRLRAVTRVGVLGAAGRMGATVCRAIVDAPDCELVAAVDPHHAGIDLHQIGIAGTGLQLAAKPEALVAAGAEVAVDFTSVEAARENLRFGAEQGIHMVVGTTGFTPDEMSELDALFAAGAANAIIAPNFSIGAVLMMRFAEMAAPYFDTAEIIELHHDRKRDAPSGTAMRTAERMSAASSDWGEDSTRTVVVPGARGGEGPGGLRVHSVRLSGLVAHQEVLLGAPGELLTIRHDSYDRTAFMPGVLVAVREVGRHPGLTIGLDPYLGI